MSHLLTRAVPRVARESIARAGAWIHAVDPGGPGGPARRASSAT